MYMRKELWHGNMNGKLTWRKLAIGKNLKKQKGGEKKKKKKTGARDSSINKPPRKKRIFFHQFND